MRDPIMRDPIMRDPTMWVHIYLFLGQARKMSIPLFGRQKTTYPFFSPPPCETYSESRMDQKIHYKTSQIALIGTKTKYFHTSEFQNPIRHLEKKFDLNQ